MARAEYLGKENGLFKYKFYYIDPIKKDKKEKSKRYSKIEKFENKNDYKERIFYYEKLENDKTIKHNFNKVIDKWYEDFAIGKFKNIKDQNSTLKYIRPFFKEVNIEDIKVVDVNNFLNEIRNSRRDKQSPGKQKSGKVSESTVKNYYATLSSIFKFATKLGYVEVNIMPSVDKPKIYVNEIEYVPEEIRENYWKIVFKCLADETEKNKNNKQRAFQKKQFELLILFALNTGVRVSELAGLRWKNIEYNKNQVNIERQLKNEELVETKSRKSRRITISENLSCMLKQHQLDCSKFNSQFVFVTLNKGEYKPFSEGAISRTWQRFLERNDIKKQRFHDIRHDTATILFLAYKDIDKEMRSEKVRQVLGHATADFTRKQYINYEPGEVQKSTGKEMGNFSNNVRKN